MSSLPILERLEYLNNEISYVAVIHYDFEESETI
jgi:hypothetical protein